MVKNMPVPRLSHKEKKLLEEHKIHAVISKDLDELDPEIQKKEEKHQKRI